MLRASDQPDLARQIGHDIVTASGTTLLGADDKAGVAVIVEAGRRLAGAREATVRARMPYRLLLTIEGEAAP